MCGRPGLALWEAGSAGRMGPDLVLWEPGSAGRMEAEGLPAVVADEGDPPGRLRRHSPDKSGSHNRWGGSAGRLAADWTLWEAGSAGRMEAEGLPAVLLALAHAARSPSVSIRSGNPSSHRVPCNESRWIAMASPPRLSRGSLSGIIADFTSIFLAAGLASHASDPRTAQPARRASRLRGHHRQLRWGPPRPPGDSRSVPRAGRQAAAAGHRGGLRAPAPGVLRRRPGAAAPHPAA